MNLRYTYKGQRACRSLDNTFVAWVNLTVTDLDLAVHVTLIQGKA